MLQRVAKDREFLYIQEVFSWDPRKAMGRSITRRIVLVVYTLRRNHDGKETVRIIGARAASRKERQAYSRPGP